MSFARGQDASGIQDGKGAMRTVGSRDGVKGSNARGMKVELKDTDGKEGEKKRRGKERRVGGA